MINLNNLRQWFIDIDNLDEFSLDRVYIIKKDLVLYGSIFLKFDTDGKVIDFLSKFDLDDPLEKQLYKISNFYSALSRAENSEYGKLYVTVGHTHSLKFFLEGGYEVGGYEINNEDIHTDKVSDKIHFSFHRGERGAEDWEEIDGYLSCNEFYLLMQIHFGLYQEEEYKKELEEKEKKGYYNEIKEKGHEEGNLNCSDTNLSKEYLKLELMRQDVTGAFEGLNIEKFYDENWSEEKKKENIDKINQKFGEIVIVEG